MWQNLVKFNNPKSFFFDADHTRCLKRPSAHPAGHVRVADEENGLFLLGGAEEVSIIFNIENFPFFFFI